jgi:hypothetical protein
VIPERDWIFLTLFDVYLFFEVADPSISTNAISFKRTFFNLLIYIWIIFNSAELWIDFWL